MDISDYENADIVFDLNKKIPKKNYGQYSAIFDFGSLEHIFDTKQVLDNLNQMLIPEGRILHSVPATNRIGHGYYMFSPIIFYDYYTANKFADLSAYLLETGSGDPSFQKWKVYKYYYDSYVSIASSFMSPGGVGTFFIANKKRDSVSGVVPQQGQFKRLYEKHKLEETCRDKNNLKFLGHI